MSRKGERAIGRELLTVKGRARILHAESVVRWARTHKQSALHRCFIWDDSKAAREYRLYQARRLIALHVVTVLGQRSTVSLYVDRAKGGGYREIQDVVRVQELREMMLSEALAELQRIHARYRQLKELAKVFEEIDKAASRHSSAKAA